MLAENKAKHCRGQNLLAVISKNNMAAQVVTKTPKLSEPQVKRESDKQKWAKKESD